MKELFSSKIFVTPLSDKYPKTIVDTMYPKIYPPVGENIEPALKPAKNWSS